jgi:uncharacterized protein (TIGR03118 family)
MGVSTLYNGLGTPQPATPLIVSIPPVGTPSGPTGVVSIPTGTTGFDVGGTSTTAHFVFAGLDGSIDAWASGTSASTSVTMSGAVFTGLTFANNASGNFLYAADFVNGGGIKVFNSSFLSTTLSGSSTDPAIPAGYAPYNIQNVGGKLYVEYAEVGTHGAMVGSGLGYVDVFDTNGDFLQRLVSNGPLNAPWGVAIAPANFGSFSNDLLVGNFGSGEIDGFDPTTGTFLGTLDNQLGQPFVNSGLWALEFGNGNTGSSPNTLYFTAGIDGEQGGLFGEIQTPEPSNLLMLCTGLLCLAWTARRKLFTQK